MGKGEEKQNQCGRGAHMSVIMKEWSRDVSTGSMHYSSESQWHPRPYSAGLGGNSPSTVVEWKQTDSMKTNKEEK